MIHLLLSKILFDKPDHFTRRNFDNGKTHDKPVKGQEGNYVFEGIKIIITL